MLYHVGTLNHHNRLRDKASFVSTPGCRKVNSANR